MNIFEIRRQNFLRIRDEKCEGNATELARKLGKAQPYVHRLLIPLNKESSQKISEKTAKLITDTFNLSEGWLDVSYEHSMTNHKPLFIQISKCIKDYDSNTCFLDELQQPIEIALPNNSLNIEVFQVLTDKYYPRIKYGEYVIVSYDNEPSIGSDSLIRFSSAQENDSKILCTFSRIESIRGELIGTNNLTNNNAPITYSLSAVDINTSQIVAIVDPLLFKA